MKASIARTNQRSWAVKVQGLARQDYLGLPLGQRLEDDRKVQAFKTSASSTHVSAKGKPTLAAVKDWVKANQPSQFFASWTSDSPNHKDDSVQIWYVA